ncbi:unnamed protein product [Clavelina lepadiformis]|uniref:NADH dehydrogenase [ubiquinone] 1 alpha subcomplex subunit 1 n=1 Tax=Clavelina lepadiformis TaxID=159417 RepID=A0ABP0G5R2_CLALP
MTWIEVLPVTAAIMGCGMVMMGSIICLQRSQYRGFMDRRVPYGAHVSRYTCHGRLNERDERLAIHPTEVNWIHPLWRPSNYK